MREIAEAPLPMNYIPSLSGYFPTDSSIYNDMKKMIYSMNQSLGNMCYNAQAVFDYSSLYKNQLVSQFDLDDKMDKFKKAQEFLENQYSKYKDTLNLYKNELASMMPTFNDNVPIDSALMM